MDTPIRPRFAAAAARIAPVGLLLLAAWLQAWRANGSIVAVDWLGWGVLAALVLAAVLLSGAAARPPRIALIGLVALLGLACWAALSASWSPLPSLARDEALLTGLYAITFALCILMLRGPLDRLLATGALVTALALLCVGIGIELVRAHDFGAVFLDARLAFPISYSNAQAAMLLVGVWPAVAIAAHRGLPVAARALATGAAGALLGGWILTQSKGGGLALILSAIVLFAVTSSRLRLLVPTALAAIGAAIAFLPLTGPYRASSDADYLAAIHHAGWAELALAAAVTLAGLVYALVDRRLELSERTVRAAGIGALALLAVAVVVGLGVFLATVSHPRAWLGDQWHAVTSPPGREAGSSHFTSLGSNRADFWRVSWHEWKKHPIAGDGARSFRVVYLQQRRSDETPQRAHSLPLEVLMEDGIVGFALLAVGLGAPLLVAARRARTRPSSAAALAGGVYWIAHASVDWNWTLPAAGIPFFVLLGIGASEDGGVPLAAPVRWVGGAVAAAVAVFAFAPPWMSARLTRNALSDPARAASDLRWAKRLDPLATDPYAAEAALTSSPTAQVKALQAAVDKQPRVADLRVHLAYALKAAGQLPAARKELAATIRLDPRDRATINRFFRQAR